MLTYRNKRCNRDFYLFYILAWGRGRVWAGSQWLSPSITSESRVQHERILWGPQAGGENNQHLPSASQSPSPGSRSLNGTGTTAGAARGRQCINESTSSQASPAGVLSSVKPETDSITSMAS
jgi:hypothetical protein